MASIEHKGKSYEVDEDGFLLKGAEEWDENWVDYVKSVEGIATSPMSTRKSSTLCRSTTRRMASPRWFVSFPRPPASR
jgi:hypothetical protein